MLMDKSLQNNSGWPMKRKYRYFDIYFKVLIYIGHTSNPAYSILLEFKDRKQC